MASAKSSFLQIYDDETKDDGYLFQISNVQAKLSLADSQMGRDMEFKAGSYKFKYGATLTDEFDLQSRFEAVEADVSTLQSDPTGTNNAAAIAQEIVDRQSGDTALSAQLSAEISRATLAEQTNATALSTEEARAQAAEAVNAQAVVDAAAVAAAATAAEEARALAAEAALSQTIQSVLSNADAGVIDSISELLSHVNAEDATLLGQIAQLQSDLTALTARVDELTNSS